MRLKFSLLLLPEVSGDVIPISYQFMFSKLFHEMLTSDPNSLTNWLFDNGLSFEEFSMNRYYVLSNLYIPKIRVDDDRLTICVPRIQFWVSFLPEVNTKEMLSSAFIDKEFSIGDEISSVRFKVAEIEEVSPVVYSEVMDYQSLSPIVVKALRQNNTIEYLNPNNPLYAQFLIEGLIERWEFYYQCPYTGSRFYRFTLLQPERRKSVSTKNPDNSIQKVAGYMIKFRLKMSAILQEFAYVTGIGDELNNGFGYIELIRKRK